jgi:hypothetical protein
VHTGFTTFPQAQNQGNTTSITTRSRIFACWNSIDAISVTPAFGRMRNRGPPTCGKSAASFYKWMLKQETAQGEKEARGFWASVKDRAA